MIPPPMIVFKYRIERKRERSQHSVLALMKNTDFRDTSIIKPE